MEYRHVGNIFSKNREVEEKIKILSLQVIENGMFEEDVKEEKALRKELDDCLSKKEVYWRKKSREVWLKEGDRNTKFFHNLVKIWRANNKIYEIQNVDGALIQDKEAINVKVVIFFSHKGQ